MKKTIVFVMAFLLLLQMTACRSAEKVPAAKEEPPVTAPEIQQNIALPEQEEELQFVVETAVWQDSAYTEEGVLLASYRFTLPSLTVCLEDGTPVGEPETELQENALAVAEVFNEHFGKWAAAEEFSEIVAGAQEHYLATQEAGSEWIGSYALELDCGVYQTDSMVSVSGMYYAYTGGAHPNTYYLGWNFDLETASFFDAKILGDEAFSAVIAEELIAQAGTWVETEVGLPLEEVYWEDYETLMADWSNYAVSFDEAGMEVVFSPYELAPYAIGPQMFRMSYDWLLPHLNQQGQILLGLDTAE